MPKHKTSFIVTLTTEEPVKARAVAKLARLKLSGQEIYTGVDGKRKAVRVSKVTVSHVGEK